MRYLHYALVGAGLYFLAFWWILHLKYFECTIPRQEAPSSIALESKGCACLEEAKNSSVIIGTENAEKESKAAILERLNQPEYKPFVNTKVMLKLIETDSLDLGEGKPHAKDAHLYHWDFKFREPRLLLPKDHALFQMMAKIQAETSMVFLQINDLAYINVTKSWVCNVKDMVNVLRRTIFVATTAETAHALETFSRLELESKGYRPLNSVLVPYIPRSYRPIEGSFGGQLRFGQRSYWDMMIFRTGLQLQILRSGVGFFVIESDAMWHADPTPVMMLHSVGDFASMDDHYPGLKHMLTGGFTLFRNTAKVITLLQKLHEMQLDVFATKGEGNEQHMLMVLIKQDVTVEVNWLNPDQFICGKFFRKNFSQPLVRHNNYKNGLRLKIERMHEEGYWFLSDDGQRCIQARNFHPFS